MEKQLAKIVSKIEQLPTLPVVSQKLMELMGDEKVSYQDIAGMIENDQSLALKILKIANSAFYGSLGKISSLEHAMVKLGMNEVKSIVLGMSVHDYFSCSSNDKFDRERFWKHAIVCSQVAKYLGKYYKIGNDDTLFLTGLIHDMGKVVLDEYLHEDFLKIIDYISFNSTSFSKAEKVVIGTTHYQIAAKVLSQWKFPKGVIMQVLYHHSPWSDESCQPGTVIVYLANMVAKWAGYSCHPSEKEIDIMEFSKSREADFVIKSGYDFDYDSIVKFINHVREFIIEEAENTMQLFS